MSKARIVAPEPRVVECDRRAVAARRAVIQARMVLRDSATRQCQERAATGMKRQQTHGVAG